MKILLLIKHFDFGGAENHVCELANELVRNGEEVWLFSGNGRQQKKLSSNVVHVPARFTEWNLISLFFRLIRLIRKEKIQVMHAHQRLPIWLATAVGLFTGTKVAGTIHGTAVHDLRSRFVRKNIDGIILISENSFSIHCRNPILQNKLFLLPNSFHIPQTNGAVKIRSAPFRLFYVSRQDRRHSNLLADIITNVWPRFLMRHPDSTFHILGDGCGSIKIDNIMKEGHLQPWIESIVCEGYVEDVYSRYENAHLVMGVGRVVGESLSRGVPALSVKWNHLGPIVTRDNFEELSFANFVSLKSNPPETDQMLNLLEEFVEQSAFYQEEASYLQQIVAMKYNIRDGVLKTMDVYNKLDAC